MAALPYITSPGNIEKALRGIKSASTPERVSQDFVKTILQIPGGSGDQVTAFLKKIGFVSPDGAPSDLYRKFRHPSTSGRAAADALKIGYQPLYARNEYMHQLTDEKLKGLIIEETGQSEDSNVVPLVLSTIKGIKKFADFSAPSVPEPSESNSTAVANTQPNLQPPPWPSGASQKLGLNLSYTINLNLPATTDVAVFNAIFKSLKDNLLKDADG